MSKFHNYSVNNTFLIALQRPDARSGRRLPGMAEECQADIGGANPGAGDKRASVHSGGV